MHTHQRWEVFDPERTLGVIVARVRPSPGDVVVATLVSSPLGAREVVDVTVLARAGYTLSESDASDLLRGYVDTVVGGLSTPAGAARREPDYRGPHHVVVTVVCRTGRTVPGRLETFWAMGWRYSNHVTPALRGDIYTLTPDGWTGWMDRRAGLHPALSIRTDVRA